MPAIYRTLFILYLLVLPLLICPAQGFAVITALAIAGMAFGVYNLCSHAKMQWTRSHELDRCRKELLKVTHSIDNELDMDKLDAAAKLEVAAQLAILVQIYTHCASEENDSYVLPAVIAKLNKVLFKYEQFSGVHDDLGKLTLEEMFGGIDIRDTSIGDKTELLVAMKTLGTFLHQAASSLRDALNTTRDDAAVVTAIGKVVQSFKERGAQLVNPDLPIYNLKDTNGQVPAHSVG